MPFSHLLKDNVSLLKESGEVVEDIKASVQPKNIIINRSDILIDTGDLIQRKMSNGGEETYEVVDPGFREGIGSIKAHYKVIHKKLGLPEAKQAVQSITYNISGANARVNNNSTDNSTNTVNINNDLLDSVQALRDEVTRLKLSEQEATESYEVIDAIEAQCSQNKPSKVVVNALLKLLPTTASLSSIGSLIVSLLG